MCGLGVLTASTRTHHAVSKILMSRTRLAVALSQLDPVLEGGFETEHEEDGRSRLRQLDRCAVHSRP